MPDDPELAQKFQEMAAAIVVSRTVFAQLYDPVIEPNIPDALQFLALSSLRNRKLPLTGEAKDRADFAEALVQAHRFNRLFDFFAKHAGKLFADTTQPSVTLQSIVNLKQTFPKAELITIGRIAALRRTCRILCEIGNGVVEKGSGFLIGPHLVLTNWHVVKAMLENGKEIKDSQLRMKFEFDALVRADGSVEKLDAFLPVEHWLVVCREAHEFETAGGTQGVGGGPWPADPNQLEDKLDFAVIELNGAPGSDRGWYRLDQAPWPVADTALDLFQFPLGRAMTYLTEKFVAPTVFRNNAQPPRILHLVNTERGSSGGLCLDMGSNAVALHQAGYEFRNGQNSEGANAEISTINAAIPLAMIEKAAGQTVRERIARAPRILRMGLNATPILGRQRFQNLIDDASRGDIRIVTVQTSFDQATRQPRPKIGKSFSALVIMQALLSSPENIIFTVTSARLTNDATTAAGLIVETIQPHSPPLPRLSGQTSLDADAIGTLVTPVIDAMVAAAGNGVLWLVIDDLDRNPVLNESTTSTFLNALYKAVASQNKLRIVLIGPTGVLPGTTGLPCGFDLVEEHVDDSDVASWIMGELGAAMPILPQFANLLAAIARSVATEIANDPLKGKTGAIAQVLQSHWVPNLQARR